MRRNRSSVARSLLDLVQAVDHRAEDGGVGAQELRVVLVEVARLGGVHLQQAIGPPAGQEDRHVRQRDHAGVLQEGGHLEAVLLADVPGDDGLAGLDREGLGGVLAHGQAQPADDAGLPADARAHEERPALLLDLQDLGALRAERLAHEAAGLRQDLVEVLAAQGELAEVGEHPLPPDHLLEIRHAVRRPPSRTCPPAVRFPPRRAGGAAAFRRPAAAAPRDPTWR